MTSMVTIACPVCQTDKHKIIYSTEESCGSFYGTLEISLCQCPQCGFVYTNPRPSRQNCLNYYTDSIDSSGHTLSFVSPDHLLYKQYQNFSLLVSKWLKRKQAGKYLEVGCGSGNSLALLGEQEHWQLLGIEPSPSAAVAQKKGLNVHQTTLEDAGLPAKSFDIVCSSHVMEHFWHPAEALHEMDKLLKDDGLLLINLPNSLFIQHGVAEFFHVEHLSHFTYYTLYQLLQNYGYQYVYPEYGIGDKEIAVLASKVDFIDNQLEAYYQPCDTRDQLRYLIQGYQLERQLFLQHLEKTLNQMLTRWSDAGLKIAAYGAGNFAYQIFNRFPVTQKIQVIIDSDPAKKGSKFYGMDIALPNTMSELAIDAVVIMSGAFIKEISETIEKSVTKPVEIGVLDSNCI